MFVLSRWSGGLVDRFGPRPPLIIGPIVAGVGFAVLALQTTDAGYWTGFFPGVVVLGLGMAITVAPLTTTVMSSVAESQAGVASGINNAVSRAAGLLAIAVLGVVMLQVFSGELRRQLELIDLPQSTRDAIYAQRIKLAGLEVGEVVAGENNSRVKQAVTQAMKESFVAGFRAVMLISAAMAFGGAVASWLLIENKKVDK
jgi:MFS family permease